MLQIIFVILAMLTVFVQLSYAQEDPHFSVTTNHSFIEAVKHLNKVEILDLSNMKRQALDQVVATIRSLNSTFLKGIFLHNIQTIGLPGFLSELNFTSTFSTRAMHNLEELDLSQNTLGAIFPSILDTLPNLRKLDLSNNFLIASSNDPMMVELLLHPRLELLMMSNQGMASYHDKLGNQHDGQLNTRQLLHDMDSIHTQTLEKVLSCLNVIDSANISLFFSDDTLWCSVFQCIGSLSPHVVEGISCKAFKQLKYHIDMSCSYFIRFPFLNSMEEIHMDNLNWFSRYTYNSHYGICLEENPVRNISFSSNGGWINIFNLANKRNFTIFSNALFVTTIITARRT